MAAAPGAPGPAFRRVAECCKARRFPQMVSAPAAAAAQPDSRLLACERHFQGLRERCQQACGPVFWPDSEPGRTAVPARCSERVWAYSFPPDVVGLLS